jgi:phage shock protein PspC (stress-responsive transcriptional regulator)
MKKLKRIRGKSYFGGVCTGIGEWTDTSVNGWRLLFIFTPGGPLLYLVLWILLKRKTNT